MRSFQQTGSTVLTAPCIWKNHLALWNTVRWPWMLGTVPFTAQMRMLKFTKVKGLLKTTTLSQTSTLGNISRIMGPGEQIRLIYPSLCQWDAKISLSEGRIKGLYMLLHNKMHYWCANVFPLGLYAVCIANFTHFVITCIWKIGCFLMNYSII